MTTDIALPADLRDAMAKFAKDAAKQERPELGRIGAAASGLSYAGESVPGNRLEVVVLAGNFHHAYYDNQYDPDTPQSPDCFSQSMANEALMSPHDASGIKQHDECKTCPKAQWGSEPTRGKGKACKQSRKLLVLPADCIDSSELVATADAATFLLSPTNGATYGKLVSKLAVAGQPVFACVSEIVWTSDPKTQYKITINPLRGITDPAVLAALMKRASEAGLVLLEPYPKNEEKPVTPPKSRKY
jgi:hypothetical protein